VQLKKVAAKTKWKLDDLVVELLHGPVRMLVLVGLLQAGLDLYRWPGAVENWLSKGLRVLLACSLTYALVKLVDLIARYWRSKAIAGDKAFNDLFFPMISKALKIFIVIMAVLATLDNLDIAGRRFDWRTGARTGGTGYGREPVRSGGGFHGQTLQDW
jgi:hypothetical protein